MQRHTLRKLSPILLLLILVNKAWAVTLDFPEIDVRLQDARVLTNGNKLVVSTEYFKRVWQYTNHGFMTVSITSPENKKEWITQDHPFKTDWSLPGLIDSHVGCKLSRLTANIGNDDGYTSEHIEVVAEMAYDTGVLLRYIIWVYPNSPGIRTQIQVKAVQGLNMDQAIDKELRSDFLHIDWNGINREVAGYYNQTQERNTANLKILKEETYTATVLSTEDYDWASVFTAKDDNGGLVLIKESHKCVNQPGIDTGGFIVDGNGVSVTGWGLKTTDLKKEWRSAWANWCILYAGDDLNRDKNIKIFDRLRYPIDKNLDIYILANTWGSNHRMAAASETNVLKEIRSQEELGIDVQQIDDGWQNPEGIPAMSTISWRPDTSKYPKGWSNVVSVAKENNIKLGLWFSLGSLNELFSKKYGKNWAADLEDLKTAFDTGRFSYYKFDMIDLHSYDELEALMKLARDFVNYTDRTVRVNWDVTENEPRIGYFFGREYGNIFLANRTVKSNTTGYIPYLMLRDAWQVSKYLNLNKFQISIQNIDMTDKQKGNAHLYNHKYAVAIALMGSPLFFQETQYISQQARSDIKQLLSTYKKNREKMYEGIVYPIGDEPDDRSWTGFQNHHQSDTGYLMVFREMNNKEHTKKLALNFCADKKIKFKNLMTGVTWTEKCDSKGQVVLNIEQPADFLFLFYSLVK
tara:strand:+ start:884 stop:2953 length:2070 start_codon:yes stop_codon:yes gene_type:complete